MTKQPSDDGIPFIARWSHRKRHGAGEDAADSDQVPGDVPEAGEDAPPEDGEGASEKRILRDEDMPPLETLHAGSDLSGFLSEGVGEELRRAALRRVFRMAAFQRRDGLDDYDGDYTTYTPLGDTVTADMRYHEERLAKKAREVEQAEARDEVASPPTEAVSEDDVTGTPPERRAVARDDEAERLGDTSATGEDDNDHSDHPGNGASGS